LPMVLAHFQHEISDRLVTNERQSFLNNRGYDSDIFVMSNTTFDEDMASNSRRASEGKQPSRLEFI